MGKSKKRSSDPQLKEPSPKIGTSTVSPDTAQKLEFGLYDKTQIIEPISNSSHEQHDDFTSRGGEASASVSTRKTGRGLSSIRIGGGKIQEKGGPNWRGKLLTFSYCLILLSFGLTMGAIGLSISPLSKLTGMPIPQMGWLFTNRGLGAIVGTLLGGWLMNYSSQKLSVRASNVLLLTTVWTTALIIALIPRIHQFWALDLLFLAYGFTGGVILIGCNLLTLWLWQSATVHFALNASAGFGSFLAPLLFWANRFDLRYMNYGMASMLTAAGILLSLSTLLHYPITIHKHWKSPVQSLKHLFTRTRKGEYRSLAEQSPTAVEEREEMLLDVEGGAEEEAEEEEEVNVLDQSNLPLTPSSPLVSSSSSNLNEEQEEELADERQEIERRRRRSSSHFRVTFSEWLSKWSLLILQGTCLFGAVALEATFGGLLATYIRAKGIARNYGEIAMMNSLFWLSLNAVRMLMIPLNKRGWLKTGTILTLSKMGVLVSVTYMLRGPHHPSTGWIGSWLFGTSVGCLYPLTISYPTTALPGYKLSPKMYSLMLTIGSSAEMLVPIIVTSSFLRMGADALPSILLAVSLVSTAAYAALFIWSFGIRSGKLPATRFAEESESLLHAVTTPETPKSPVHRVLSDEALERTPGTPA